MMRFFSFVIQIAILTVVALWLADQPGTAHIVWHDTVIETSAAFLIFFVLLLAYAFHLLFRLWHFVRHSPVRWRMRRALHKMQNTQDQLTRGLIAIASGNASEAGKLAIAARKNANTHSGHIAAQWLQAQAAQLAGDHGTARNIFRTLANDKDAAILGYRGLITEAKRLGKWDEIDRLLTELQCVKPTTPWLSLMKMESAARKQQWGEAEAALSHAVAARLLDGASGRRRRAALRIAASRAALIDGQKDMAVQAAEQAAKQSPDWLPSLINLAETLAAADHPRAASRTIERAWKQQPHPQLAALLRRMEPNALEAYKKTERLCRTNPHNVESHMALAEAAMAAHIWGEARRHLLACVDTRQATQNVYKMLARLERRERGEEAAANIWLTRAADASADPAWTCSHCGATQDIWQPVCPSCNNFASIDWQMAGQGRKNLLAAGDSESHD